MPANPITSERPTDAGRARTPLSILDVPRRACWTALVAAQLPEQSRVSGWSRSKVFARRDSRLRRLLSYAARTVPHYRELFGGGGPRPGDIRTAEDLGRLPLLPKDALRTDPERFRSESRRGRRAVPFVTSGSTGARLTIYHDLPSLLCNRAYTAPEKAVVRNAAGAGGVRRQMTILYTDTTVRKIWKAYREHTLIGPPTSVSFVEVGTPVEEVVRRINELRPDMISGYGSYLEAFFRHVSHRGIDLHRPKIVRYGGDVMTTAGRELIEQEFGIFVHSGYGAVEQMRLGFTCEHGTGFHLREDLACVRLVDGEGRDVEEGEAGEVVITNLMNRGTVLVNYRLGDIAVMSSEPCACGRPFRRLTRLEGRVEDVLTLPGGRMVHPRSVWSVFKPLPEILRYQLVQQGADELVLKLWCGDHGAFDREAERVREPLLAMLGPVRLQIVPMAEHEARAGKFRTVVGWSR